MLLSTSRLESCDSCEWWYLLKTLLITDVTLASEDTDEDDGHNDPDDHDDPDDYNDHNDHDESDLVIKVILWKEPMLS